MASVREMVAPPLPELAVEHHRAAQRSTDPNAPHPTNARTHHWKRDLGTTPATLTSFTHSKSWPALSSATTVDRLSDSTSPARHKVTITHVVT